MPLLAVGIIEGLGTPDFLSYSLLRGASAGGGVGCEVCHCCHSRKRCLDGKVYYISNMVGMSRDPPSPCYRWGHKECHFSSVILI